MLIDALMNYVVRRAPTRGLLLAVICTLGVAQARASSVQTAAKPQEPQTQTTNSKTAVPESADTVSAPVYKDYRGVHLGMTADEARRKLDAPETKEKKHDVIQVNAQEMVSLYYDKEGKVRVISVIYTGQNAPSEMAVLGETVAPDASGRVHKRKLYPQAGYRIAYSRTAGDSPTVTVTMQKMGTAAPSAAKQ